MRLWECLNRYNIALAILYKYKNGGKFYGSKN